MTMEDKKKERNRTNCMDCGIALSKENTYVCRNKLRQTCKKCWVARTRSWGINNRDRRREKKRLNARKNRRTGYLYSLTHPRDKSVERTRDVLHYAVRRGLITRPDQCELCREKPKAGKIEAHHYQGYEIEYAYEVLWVCPPCHRMVETTTNLTGRV